MAFNPSPHGRSGCAAPLAIGDLTHTVAEDQDGRLVVLLPLGLLTDEVGYRMFQDLPAVVQIRDTATTPRAVESTRKGAAILKF